MVDRRSPVRPRSLDFWRSISNTLSNWAESAPIAATRFAEQIFGSLAGKNVVIFGAGNMAESAARELSGRGPQSVLILSHNDSPAKELVLKLRAQLPALRAGAFAERWQHLAAADLVISATSSPEFVFTAEDMRRLAIARNNNGRDNSDRNRPENDRREDPAVRKLILIDLALPRDIDPAVRAFDGVLLYDLEDLERAVEPRKEVPQNDHVLDQVVDRTSSWRRGRGRSDIFDPCHSRPGRPTDA